MSKTAIPINPILSERIRAERKAHNLTQAELAGKIGISDQTLRLYETNKRGLSSRTISALAECFSCQPKYLTGESIFREADMEEEFNTQIWPPLEKALRHMRGEMLKVNCVYVDMLQKLFGCKVQQHGVNATSDLNYSSTMIIDPAGKKYAFDSLDMFLSFMSTFAEDILPHLHWRLFMYPNFVREYADQRSTQQKTDAANSCSPPDDNAQVIAYPNPHP